MSRVTIIHKVRSSEEHKAVREIDSKATVLSNQCLLGSAETTDGLIVVAKPELEYSIKWWIAITAIVGTRIQSRHRCVDAGVVNHTIRQLGSKCIVSILREGGVVKRSSVCSCRVCKQPEEGVEGLIKFGNPQVLLTCWNLS